jgi:hypothetical protein
MTYLWNLRSVTTGETLSKGRKLAVSGSTAVNLPDLSVDRLPHQRAPERTQGTPISSAVRLFLKSPVPSRGLAVYGVGGSLCPKILV